MPSAYAAIPTPGTTPKPRSKRITMMIDWGIPYRVQEDLLEMGGEFCDLAKIAVGQAALLSDAALRKKLKMYADHKVEAFPGGMLLEYAFFHDAAEAYLQATRDAGFPVIEVSDNSIRFEGNEKYDLIRRCIADYGLRVLGETGRKYEKTDPSEMVTDALKCIDAGSWKILVEAAEFFEGGKFQTDLVKRLANDVPLDAMLFELPGPHIKDIHHFDIHAMLWSLIDAFGPDVNIANVPPDMLLICEMQRQGIGVSMRVDAQHAVAAR
ncbi:MAG: phosphosulfolactate synthase [Candidatus Eremiobacteraeota bacterium]|nr:phosphosulfolactate synthase [Candidatus Eremiobacteraeota bacterium]